MKLYVTFTSPYARLARILVLEKALEDRVEIIAAKTRAAGSPYYQDCQGKATCWKLAAARVSIFYISRRQCPISGGSPLSGMPTA
jgi:hypothetical protein